MAVATSVRDILARTRKLFAETHWTTGNFYTEGSGGKALFCAVGGLRHTVRGGDPWEADNEFTDEDSSSDEFTAYAEAARQVCLAISGPHRLSVLDNDWSEWTYEEIEDATIALADVEMLEGIIIAWNDSRDDVLPILEAFDAALAKVVA